MTNTMKNEEKKNKVARDKEKFMTLTAATGRYHYTTTVMTTTT